MLSAPFAQPTPACVFISNKNPQSQVPPPASSGNLRLLTVQRNRDEVRPREMDQGKEQTVHLKAIVADCEHGNFITRIPEREALKHGAPWQPDFYPGKNTSHTLQTRAFPTT